MKTKKDEGRLAADDEQVGLIDDASDEAQMDEEEQSVSDPGPEPWSHPVNGTSLLGDLVATVRRHVVVTQEAAVAVALWVVFTHVAHVFRIIPLLALLSPTRGCGKTTLLTVLEWLVRRPMTASNMTPAVLFRAIDQESPTVLVDEGDTFIAKDRELRGLLNAGHNRTTAHVFRIEKGRPRRFNVASPKVIAAIGTLPDTIIHRSVVIEMRRKSHRDGVKGLDATAETEIRILARKSARWAQDNEARLRRANPQLPGELINRAADNWYPLFAIAECAGGKWPKVAQQAALALAKDVDTSDDAIGEALLRDIKLIVSNWEGTVIPSVAIVGRLVEMEHRPWPELNRGRPLTAPKMARVLKPFGIQPGLFRQGASVVRGYKPGQFADAFARYAN